MFRRLAALLHVLIACAATVGAQAPTPVPGDQRPADRDAIRAHIMSIFDGFRQQDRAKLRETHAEHWRGFLIGSTRVIRGVDEYMAYIEPGLHGPADTSEYVLSDFDVLFYGDVAVVDFVADAVTPGGNRPVFRIMDIYTKNRDGSWIQSASHTVFHPAMEASLAAQPGWLSESEKARLLAAREEL